MWQSALSGGYFTTVAECSILGVFYWCGRVLCMGGYFTIVAECSVWGVLYYGGRVLCLGGILILWQSALSEGYFTTVAECSDT